MVRFIPHMDSSLWARKSIREFETIDDLRLYIADHVSRISHFIGTNQYYRPKDVILLFLRDIDPILKWRNYHSVTVNGKIIGYCGE